MKIEEKKRIQIEGLMRHRESSTPNCAIEEQQLVRIPQEMACPPPIKKSMQKSQYMSKKSEHMS